MVRIIEYTLDDPARPGAGERHRLLTTLLDAELDPATTLVCLYHERWEEELTIDELKTHQRERPVLRSQTPAGVVQEVYGLLLAHYLVRVLMHEAAASVQIDPQRVSFTATLKILRCRLPECPASQRGRQRWYRRLVEEVAEEIIEPRRNRVNPRVIKRKMSKWPKKKARTPSPSSTHQTLRGGHCHVLVNGIGANQVKASRHRRATRARARSSRRSSRWRRGCPMLRRKTVTC